MSTCLKCRCFSVFFSFDHIETKKNDDLLLLKVAIFARVNIRPQTFSRLAGFPFSGSTSLKSFQHTLMGSIQTFQEKKQYSESLTGLQYFIALKVFLNNVLSVDWVSHGSQSHPGRFREQLLAQESKIYQEGLFGNYALGSGVEAIGSRMVYCGILKQQLYQRKLGGLLM